jgi:hypothetical protein
MIFKVRFVWFCLASLLMPSLACTQEVTQFEPTSHLDGVITVNAAIDSTGDYSGIEVIVTDGNENGPDTLGYAVTNMDGRFAMDVAAADRGIFPLVLKRGAAVLSVSQLVVAPSDTAHVTAELPLGERIPMVRSNENSGWVAFRNADLTHNERVTQLMSQGSATSDQLGRAIELAAEVLWSIRSSYPGTMAADLASAKSVVMLDGWNDSLLVARLGELDPSASGFAEAVQAGGRAETRLHGIESGIALLHQKQMLATNQESKASIQREITQAYLDVGRKEDAISAAESLKVANPNSPWAEWAERAQYEANNLLPGAVAPSFTLATNVGGVVALDSLAGNLVVLDFWSPRDRQAALDIPEIARVVESDGWSQGLAWISVALEPDQDLYEAFFEGRTVPGIHIRDTYETIQDLITRYNVEIVPTRYLIGKDGRIIEKYAGNSLLRMSTDIENMNTEG